MWVPKNDKNKIMMKMRGKYQFDTSKYPKCIPWSHVVFKMIYVCSLLSNNEIFFLRISRTVLIIHFLFLLY